MQAAYRRYHIVKSNLDFLAPCFSLDSILPPAFHKADRTGDQTGGIACDVYAEVNFPRQFASNLPGDGTIPTVAGRTVAVNDDDVHPIDVHSREHYHSGW